MYHFVSSATSSSSTNKVTSGMRDHPSPENIPFSFQSSEKEYHYNFSSQIKLRNKENKFRFLQDTEISFAENKKGNQGKLFQLNLMIFEQGLFYNKDNEKKVKILRDPYRMFSQRIVLFSLLNNNRIPYSLPPQGSYSSYGHQYPPSSCICWLLLSSMSSNLSRVSQILSH